MHTKFNKLLKIQEHRGVARRCAREREKEEACRFFHVGGVVARGGEFRALLERIETGMARANLHALREREVANILRGVVHGETNVS